MHKVVIVGGGIAGILAATHLGRHLKGSASTSVLLIDHNFAHVWKPMLHTFAAGTANYSTQSFSFAPLAKRNGIDYWPGELSGLDRERKTLELGPITLPDGHSQLPGRSIPYDTLVLAIGSHSNDFHTPGVSEHCYFMDDVGQAQTLNAAIRSETIRNMDAGAETGVVIIGGGATGVELAAELTRRTQIFAGYVSKASAPHMCITLIETGPRLLAAFPEKISRAVEEKLTKLGVDVRTGTKVVGADEHGVSIEGGHRIDAPIRVWAAGVKAPPVAAKLGGLEINRKGQIAVRPTLQAKDDDSVFALGDCASCAGGDGRPLPTTAQVVRQQGLFLARSLARHITGNSAPFYPMGEQPQGIIMYTPDGYMSAQLMHPGRPNFASGDWFKGTPEEIREEASGYIAYCGPFHTHEEKQHLTHSMFVSLFPNWLGQTQPRVCKIEGDMLHLSTASPIKSGGKETNSYLTWKRAEPNA